MGIGRGVNQHTESLLTRRSRRPQRRRRTMRCCCQTTLNYRTRERRQRLARTMSTLRRPARCTFVTRMNDDGGAVHARNLRLWQLGAHTRSEHTHIYKSKRTHAIACAHKTTDTHTRKRSGQWQYVCACAYENATTRRRARCVPLVRGGGGVRPR